MPTTPLPVTPGLPPQPAQSLGFGGTDPSQNAPVPPTDWALSEERLKREKATSTGDYVGSIWRQDGLVDGLVAHLAGNEAMPDPNYSPFSDPNWADLTKGVWPDLVPHLYQAHSAAHALYLKDRLLSKQEDLTRLGDLGWKGNVGRFALNAVLPDQLLMSMAGGFVARGAKAVQGVRAARMATEATELGRAAAGAGEVAGEAARAASPSALAAGVAFGAAENAAYEKMRQSVNFEDDTAGVLEAGLMGAAFTMPFALAGSRGARSVAAAAEKEHSVLRALKAVEDGAELTPDQVKAIHEVHTAHKALQDFEAGHLDEAGVQKAMDEFQGPLHPEVEKGHAEALTEELFPAPERAPDAPAEVLPAAPAESLVVPPGTIPEAHPHEAYVGREVSWMGPEGDTLDGTVKSFNPEIGKLIVKTPDGMKAVHASKLDQFVHDKAPEGFKERSNSVGAAQTKGTTLETIGSQRTALAEATIPGTNVKVPLRFDIYATLNASPVQRIRELTYKIMKDAIQNDKFEAQPMTASEWKKQMQRTAGGRFHVEARKAYLEARKAANVPVWRQSSFAHEFYSLVSKVTRGDSDVLMQHPELAPMLRKAAAAQSQAYATLIGHAKAAGVKGAEHIEANDFYVNRMWHHGNIRDAIAAHGDNAVLALLASAIQDKAGVLERMRKAPGTKEVRDSLTNRIIDPGKTDAELLMKKAKGFLRAVRELEFNPALREIHLAGRDMGTLRRELADLGVDPKHVDDLVDLMFEVRPQEGDAGRAGSLKFRFGLDENASVVTPNGPLKLSDLFENDARVLVDVYTNSMAGHIGLAKQGIRSQADWMAELRKASEEAIEKGANGSQVARDMALLQDVHKHILGRPMSTQDFSYANRAATAFRGYTRGVMLPQLGIAAAFEMNKAISVLGFKSLLQQMPSLSGFVSALRQGYIPDKGLAKDIMVITGFGQEKAAAYHRGQELENGFFGQTLTRAEAGANRVSHAVDVMSGNASFTSLTKQLSGMMATQQAYDIARGAKKLDAATAERWVGQGLSHDDIPDVLAKLKEFSTSSKSGAVDQIRHEDWLADSPKTYEQFQTFLSRQVRDVIQDHDIGESMPFMHTTLGKMFAELKTFFLVAHAKNFLKQLHYWDSTAAQVWAIGFLGESLAYMTQTAVNYPTELEQRLTPEKIATAAFFRMSAAGTASMLAETGYQLLSGGDSLVQPGMTANTDNRSFLNTPSLIVAKRLLNAPSTLGGLVLGTDVTTKKEGQDLWGSVPGGNLYGLKSAGQYWASTLPKSDPSKVYAP